MEWKQYNTEKIKSRYLFKFLSEKNLMKFLHTGNIWFSRSDKFGDKMECVMISDLTKKIPDFQEIEARKRRHIISCFHEGNKETLAFWDTYSEKEEDRRKYALRFNREDFIDRIEPILLADNSIQNIVTMVHGKVKYKNLIGVNSTRLQENKVKYSAFRKEYAFAYEREYRFDILLADEFKDLGFNLKIGNPSEIDFSILVNPLLKNSDYINCLETLKKTDFAKKFKKSILTRWLKPELWK